MQLVPLRLAPAVSHRPRGVREERVPEPQVGGAQPRGTLEGRAATGDVRGDSRRGGRGAAVGAVYKLSAVDP
jgi:hypothetical protein